MLCPVGQKLGKKEVLIDSPKDRFFHELFDKGI